jgi:zinc protease
MSRIIAAVSACLALLACTASARAAELKTTTMGNGLTVIIREDHSAPLVSVQVWVKSGSSNETVNTNGISHMIEHLALGTTNKRNASDMDIEMESLGGVLAAETSRDWTHFSTTVHPRFAAQALDILADAMTNAQFPEQDLEREKTVILEEIKRKQMNPRQMMSDALYKEMYGSHPYSLPIEGTEVSVRQMSRQQILDFYQTYYTAPNMAVVMVGDIDFQQAVSDVGKSFQILRRSPAPEPYPTKLEPPATAKAQVLESYARNCAFSIGFLGPPGTYFRDVCCIDTIAAYLGIGYRSWVIRELKQNLKLALEGRSEFMTSKFPAPVSLNVACEESKLADAESAVRAKIADIGKNGIGEEALEMAKLSILGDYAFQRETVDGLANGYGFYYAISSPEFADKYVALIQSLTNEDIQQAASKYLDLDRSITIKVVPMHIEGPTEEDLK